MAERPTGRRRSLFTQGSHSDLIKKEASEYESLCTELIKCNSSVGKATDTKMDRSKLSKDKQEFLESLPDIREYLQTTSEFLDNYIKFKTTFDKTKEKLDAFPSNN